jgi:Cd2+/Zn2+-exporting ATPase
MKSKAFRVVGLDCADEAAALKREVGPLVGGEGRLRFDFLKGKMTVLSPPAELTPRMIRQAVARTGMRAEPWTDQTGPARGWKKHRRNALTALSGLLAAAGLALHVRIAGLLPALAGGDGATEAVPLSARVFFSAAILAGGWFVLPRAWYAARRLRPDMNLLMTVAVFGAVALGEWFEAATVTFLFSLSLSLEAWSMRRARRAVEALLDLSPPTARLRGDDGREVEVPAEDVAVGSVFIVRPGERIPLDGAVLGGSSDVDQAPITGESLPVLKERDAEVFAGTINGEGALEIRSTRPAHQTTLARIIQLVEEASARRAASERWVERFARVYTPVVMGLAILLCLAPPLLLAADWSTWVYRSLVLLVIGCPCALVISTPVSIVASLASAARHGVLVKGGAFVEAPSRLRAVALDKTGTVTEGRARVREVIPLVGHDENELLQRAAALESHSEHPLARAVVAHARERGLDVPAVDRFRGVRGKGVQGSIGGRPYWLGSHRYLEERGQETPEIHSQLEALSAAGRSVVVVGNERHVCGFISLADTVRPGAERAIERLKRLGVERIVLLTGDNEGTARAIGEELGVDEVRAELLPAEKLESVEQLVERYGEVAMVGDGVNDAPALARASLGIAMGAAGSDAAIETADVALMADDLEKLPWLVSHSRRTLAIVRQNIVFALGVKLAVLALATLGAATLWLAIAADMGASLLVIANGLRLLGSSETPATS